MVLGEREHRHTNVREDEVLGQKVEQLEDLFGALPRVIRQIVVRVVRLTDAAEEHRHDARQLGDLRYEERTVRHQHEQCRLENGKVTDARELGQVRWPKPEIGSVKENRLAIVVNG